MFLIEIQQKNCTAFRVSCLESPKIVATLLSNMAFIIYILHPTQREPKGDQLITLQA